MAVRVDAIEDVINGIDFPRKASLTPIPGRTGIFLAAQGDREGTPIEP